MTMSAGPVCGARPQTVGIDDTLHEYRGLKQVISAGVPPLLQPLVRLVTQFLFPEPKGWITEWTGAHGYDVIAEAVSTRFPLTHRPLDLVVTFLKKPDVYGLERLEEAVGGKEELSKLLGKYNPQRSLPIEIDDEMQKNLSEICGPSDHRVLSRQEKVTTLSTFQVSRNRVRLTDFSSCGIDDVRASFHFAN